MALPDGLTAAEAADYMATIRGDYDQTTRIEVLTNERKIISTVPAAVLGGQIDCTRIELDPVSNDGAKQEVGISRYAKSITLYDPSHAVALDSGSPADGALYLDRSIRVVVSIRGKLRWYDVPVFTGPITHLDREGALITLEAEGCEAFGMGAAYTTGTLKGTKVAAFRSLMYRSGEVDAWMDVPTSKEKLAKPKVIGRDTRVWDMAFFIMASMNRLCFYDGYGRLRTPGLSQKPVIDFAGGNDGLLLREPQVTFSTENFRNLWWELTSTKAGKDVEAFARLKATHPLSPTRIGRNGKPRYLMGTENKADLRTKSRATERAETMLSYASADAEVRADVRPVWHLSPYDWALMRTDEWSMPFAVREFSLPLAGGEMTLGYRKNLPQPNVTRIRGM
jgi:hypothetical protein